MTMPTWLRNQLQTQGLLDEQGRGRRARAHTCRTCRQVVLEGYDDDICARLRTVDPTPLSPLGEALALLGGRYTATLTCAGGRLELHSRTAGQMRLRPAANPGNHFDVLAEHRCHWPPLPAAPSYQPDNTAAAHQPGCSCPPPF